MNDTTAASVGFVLAGVALAGALYGWTVVGGAATLAAVGLVAVALVAFGLRRYALLDRQPGAGLAGVGAVGAIAALGYAVYLGAGPFPSIATAVTAGLAAAFALADWLGFGTEPVIERVGVTATAAAIGALGIASIFAWAILAFLLVGLLAPDGLGQSARTVVSTLASGAGTLTVVVLYLRWSGRELSFLDLEWPGLRGLAYFVGGTLVILGGNVALGLLFQRAGVESASHTVVQTAESDPTVLLVLIPLSYLVIAPGEELLYRNVVQKTLRETFSPVAGVVVASVIFAAVHLPAYSSPGQSLNATVNTLVIVFVLALVLGTLYERTRNVVVPMLAHGTFNAIAFAVTYGQFTGAFGA